MFIYLSMLETTEQKNKFEELYNSYRKLMFYVAKGILKDDFLAEDAVHQTFLKIIEIIDKIDDVHGHKTKSYIVTMVKNCSINLYHKRQRQATIPLEEIEGYFSEGVELDESDDLTKAILKLPFIYSEILTLKYVQEFSNIEIAEMLNITEATIRKRLERAKNRVQEILEEEGKKLDL